MQYDDDIHIPANKSNSGEDRRLTLHSKHQAPVTRYRDTPEKQTNRRLTDSQIRKQFKQQVNILAPKLRELGYNSMARFIEQHVRVDARSTETIQGIRASNLLLQKQTEQAQFIMKFVTGRDIFSNDAPDAPIRHKSDPVTGGVEMLHLKVTPEISPSFDKHLLKNIGSGRK